MNTLFAQLWKEYTLSDSRYLTLDVFTVCVETITVVRSSLPRHLACCRIRSDSYSMIARLGSPLPPHPQCNPHQVTCPPRPADRHMRCSPLWRDTVLCDQLARGRILQSA